MAGVDRATLLARAAHCTAWTGRPAEAIRLTDAAMALVDPTPSRCAPRMLHQRRGLYLCQAGRAADGVPDIERAVDLIPAEPPSAERAAPSAASGSSSCWPAGMRVPRDCEAAVAVARTVGARAEEADALASLGQALSGLGDHPRRSEVSVCARSIALEQGDDETLVQTAIALSFGLTRDGQPAAAVEVALAGAEEPNAQASPWARAFAGSTLPRPPTSSAGGTSPTGSPARCSTAT